VTVLINLSNATPKQAAVVRSYLVSKDQKFTATVHLISSDTVRKTLSLLGVDHAMRRRLETGEGYQIKTSETFGGNVEPVVEQIVVAAPEPVRMDIVDKHRYEAQIAALKAEAKVLTRRVAAAEDHRNSILGLSVEPAYPEPTFLTERHVPGAQAILLHISDTHVGETIDRQEVAGVNVYNREIARKRMGRLFEKASILSTSAWPASDEAPSKVHILLGGDLISGHGLHPEHAETDYGTAYEQVKDAAAWISGGILRLHLELHEHFKTPIPMDVLSVGGNHGRSTPGKPRTKLVSLQSYDTLVADFVEAGLRQHDSIRHFQPRGFDAYFSAVGWPCLLTHGDRMGSGGGTGFIGPMATIIKGHRKIVDTEHRQRRPVRWVLSGHFHTSGVTPFGFANGASCGYGEFARSIRADPEAAQQNYIVLGERLGLIRYQPIVLGVPEEGSIYDPKSGLILPERFAEEARLHAA
jgi:hypothetical protein